MKLVRLIRHFVIEGRSPVFVSNSIITISWSYYQSMLFVWLLLLVLTLFYFFVYSNIFDKPSLPKRNDTQRPHFSAVYNYPSNKFLFFCPKGFDFGLRQNGSRVMNVEVPHWAKGSTRLFMLIHRQVSLIAL